LHAALGSFVRLLRSELFRSLISRARHGYPASAEQARIAKAYITQLNDTHAFDAPIVTVIEPGRTFFPAEDYHQDFLTRHPTYPYIVINDLPKIEALKRLFPDSYRVEPVLVATAGSSN
jgi:peptide-methionine (S)-S-oxide reductase